MKKYPRTYHLSFSPEVHSDDKIINKQYESEILKSEVVITVKMDGGNCCIKPNQGVFARTHTQETACSSFDYIKNKHYYSKLHLLNPNYWYFGENMYAIHSIQYLELKDYFYLFNIYDTNKMKWLSWNDLQMEANRCEFEMVPNIFSGHLDKINIKDFLKAEIKKNHFGGETEGFVIRKLNAFSNEDFEKSVAKYVRNGHLQTDKNWEKNWHAHKLMVFLNH